MLFYRSIMDVVAGYLSYDCSKVSKLEYRKNKYPNSLLLQQRVCGIVEMEILSHKISMII